MTSSDKIAWRSAALIAAAMLGMSAPALASNQRAPWGDWQPFGMEPPKWDGRYLSIYSGFELTAHRRGRTTGGPVIGVEAGQMWRDGDFVYGVAGSFSYMKPFAFSGVNNSAFTEYTRDFAGTARAKFGYLVNPNVLLYSAVGVSALNETWRNPIWAGGASDQRFAVRPEVAAGFEWQVNNTTRIWGEIKASAPVR